MHNNLGLYRFCAKLIDTMGFIISIVGIDILANVFLTTNISNILVLNCISITIFSIIYLIWFVILPAKFGWSLGKLMLGLRIKPRLNLVKSFFREPFLYMIIPAIIASIFYNYNQVVSSYILLIDTFIAGILVVMFYFKKDIWNQLNHVEVVEKGE